MGSIVITRKQWSEIGRRAGWPEEDGIFRATAEKTIRDGVDEAFVKLATQFGVKHGDWAPDQEAKLLMLVSQIAELAEQWRRQNS